MSKDKNSSKNRFRKGARSFFRNLGIALIAIPFRLVWWPKITYESESSRKALRSGKAIVISNHCYWFDPLMMYILAFGTNLSVVTAKEVLTGFKGKLLDVLGCISLDRSTMDLVCLRECSARVRAGETVAIFPEGQISFTGELLEFKAGVAFIAAQTAAPVIPVYISGDYRPFGHIKVMVGDSIDLSGEFSKFATAAEIETATDILYNRMIKLRDKLFSSMTEKERRGVEKFRWKFAKNREQALQDSEEKTLAHK